MFDNTSPAGKGLKKIYYTQLLALICLILAFIRPLAAIANLGLTVAGFLCLFGLVQLSPVHSHYRNALTLTVINVVLRVISVVIAPFNGLLANIAGDVLAFLIVYFLISATNSLLTNLNEQGLVNRGNVLLKLYLILYGLSILSNIVGLLIPMIAAILDLVCGILSIAALLQYISYLKKSSTIFLDNLGM